MQRALELALLGKGSVSPNPMVGCVIVHDDKIIGEGWHQKYGAEHAEVAALNSVKDKHLLKDATAYVTLEPCAHHGNTPPCADRLVAEKVKKVIICNTDPNPLVNGKGIEKLKNAGIAVDLDFLSAEGKQLNKRYFSFTQKKRPYIILKWAETADGFIAKTNYDSKWISNALSRKMVHQWRAEEDAILVATNTAHYDNPRLNVRNWKGENPIRIVIDRNLRLDSDLNLFDGSQQTICYNLKKNSSRKNIAFVKLTNDRFFELLFEDLYKRKILSVIIEGGAEILSSLIRKNLWDEARVFKSLVKFEAGIAAPNMNRRYIIQEQEILDNMLSIYENNASEFRETPGQVRG